MFYMIDQNNSYGYFDVDDKILKFLVITDIKGEEILGFINGRQYLIEKEI